MTIAKIAYLTSPAPNRFILNYQEEGKDGIERVEITKAHLANILIDGTALALRETSVPHRVPVAQTKTGNADERTTGAGA
jgi:hypothetical protein